jgi:hypothetical protein
VECGVHTFASQARLGFDQSQLQQRLAQQRLLQQLCCLQPGAKQVPFLQHARQQQLLQLLLR